MAKHSLNLKLEVTNAVLSGSDGSNRVATRYGLSRTLVKRWTAAFRSNGVAGLKKPYSTYSIDFKQQAILSVIRDGHSISETLITYNIPAYTSLQSWIRLYNEGGIKALQNKPRGRPRMTKQDKPRPAPECKPLQEMTREELLEELEDRRAEVACLKKLKALVQSGQLATKPKR